MNDEEIKEVCARLDEAMSKLYKKATPMGSYDIQDPYDILEKVNLLEKMIDELWLMEIKHMVKSKELHKEIDSLEGQLRKSDNENKELEERMICFNEMISEVDRMKKEMDRLKEENRNLKSELKAYHEPKTKRGNKNACRKDIDEMAVYRMVRLEGRSISEVARMYNADRKTIRKYIVAGENYYYYDNEIEF